jgi:anti-anti-sigma factor
MDIRQEQVGGVSVLAPEGRLDTDSASDLELALQDLKTAGAKHFVVDLGEIGYVSSAGLRVLLMLAKQLEGGKGTLRLAGLNAQVKQVFDIAGFTKLFSLFPDKAAALKGHPGVNEASPALGNLAAKLIGASQSDAAPDADDAKMARAAAGLLGVKAKPSAAAMPATPAPRGKSGVSDKTMALASLKTPVAAGAKPARTPAPVAAEKPGFFARLFAIFKRK